MQLIEEKTTNYLISTATAKLKHKHLFIVES